MALLRMLRGVNGYPAWYRAPQYTPTGTFAGWVLPLNPGIPNIHPNSGPLVSGGARTNLVFPGSGGNVLVIRWGKSRGFVSVLFPAPPPPPVPTLLSIAPPGGFAGGAIPVTITGTNLLGATSATIGGLPVGAFSVLNATTITGLSNSGLLPGVYSLIVQTPFGPLTLPNCFTVTSPP